jgi:hypothetical protein
VRKCSPVNFYDNCHHIYLSSTDKAVHALMVSLFHYSQLRRYKMTIKSKVVPLLFLTEHRAMKVYWGSGAHIRCRFFHYFCTSAKV